MLLDHLEIAEASRFMQIWPASLYAAIRKGTLPDVIDPETGNKLLPLPALRARYERRTGGQYGWSEASLPLARRRTRHGA